MTKSAPVVDQPHPHRRDPPQRRLLQLSRQRWASLFEKRKPGHVQLPRPRALLPGQFPAAPAKLHTLNFRPALPVALNGTGYQPATLHRLAVFRGRIRQHVEIEGWIDGVEKRRRVRPVIRRYDRQREHRMCLEKFPQPVRELFHAPNLIFAVHFANAVPYTPRAMIRYFTMLLASTVCLSVMPARADEWQGPILAVIQENDKFSDPFTVHHQDRHYTQGLKLVYLFGEDASPAWMTDLARNLPEFGIETHTSRGGFVFGQNIYTPGDLSAKTLISADRPYAGWLYLGAVLQRRGTVAGAVPVLESFEVDLGFTGQETLAEASQKTIHRWYYPDNIPRGWGNQLETEPALLLKYGRVWRLAPAGAAARYVDLMPHVGAALGNVQIFGAAGATLRVGWNLPNDFGVQNIDSTIGVNGGFTPTDPPFGIHLLGRVEGRAVGQNLFLDGNTLRAGPSVDKLPLVADLSWGFVFQITRYVDVTYLRVFRTEEFEGQRGNDLFGSVTVKAKFDF